MFVFDSLGKLMFVFDSLGKLIIELRDDPDVDAIAHGRIRGFEPAPGDADTSPSTIGPRYRNAFVVLVIDSTLRHPRLPVQEPRIAARCYGRTPQEAMALYVACSDAIHAAGPRVHANGLGIYVSHDDTGGTAQRDPDTGQPYVEFVISLVATTQAVA